MVFPVRSLGLHGVSGYEVMVECDLSGGLPNFTVVGLPDAAVSEARERVRSAIKNCGFSFPVSRITVNLAPAHVKKIGTLYDLPILIGILCAGKQLKIKDQNCAFIGELSLSGQLRPARGMLPMALCAKRAGITSLFVPAENAAEATLAGDITVYPVENVAQLVRHFTGEQPISSAAPCQSRSIPVDFPDFSQVKGQDNVKRALEIAAAGGHNLLMCGPPGSGKSMLARRLPGILPDMTRAESLDTTEIHSVMGLTSASNPLIHHRPFRAPHHTISPAGMAGGGTALKPGEISLAHNGVLFLDELPEFHKDVLEVLRQPLEDGQVQLSRASGSVCYPSEFMLVCAMNPCKCGWHGHPSGRCRCTDHEVSRYLSRLSGPLLDRIDLFVEVEALAFEELSQRTPSESSADIKLRVDAARTRQNQRGACNAKLAGQPLETHCVLNDDCQFLMRGAYTRMGLTARSYDRIRRVARTIADLDGSPHIDLHHLAEALQYRPPQYLKR